MTAGDPVLVDSAPSERAPAPVPVEWGVLDEEAGVVSGLTTDRSEHERYLGAEGADALRAVLAAADYDRMAKALALLATVDVAALKRVHVYALSLNTGGCLSDETLLAHGSAIAAIETATRATREGT